MLLLNELGPYCARTTAESALKHLVAYEFQLAALDASLLECHSRLCSASASDFDSISVAAKDAPVETKLRVQVRRVLTVPRATRPRLLLNGLRGLVSVCSTA